MRCKDMDNPHQMGSGITYAKRYGLQSLYGLPSEDDDGNKAGEGKKTNDKPKVVKSDKAKVDIQGDLDKLKEKVKTKSIGVEELGQSI